MRIIAGTYRGFKLYTPPSQDLSTRPLLDRVKESVFSILNNKLQDAHVLDLFSGTGSIGLEAISRGAQSVVFIEKNLRNIGIIEKNIEKLKVQNQSQVIKGLIPQKLKSLKTDFDVVFLDPPYKLNVHDQVMDQLITHKLLKPKGIVILHRSKLDPVKLPNHYTLYKDRVIGDSHIYIFERNEVQ